MKHPVFNYKKENVGFWSDEEFPRTYYTTRNYKNQIFTHPKYNNAVGLDTRIIRVYLIPNKVHMLDYLITGFEKESFHAIIPLVDFIRKAQRVNFDKNNRHGWGEQLILSLNEFRRSYSMKVGLR